MTSPHSILSEVTDTRAMIRDRLQGMTGMTEREVLAAGQSLGQLVSRARSHVELTRGILEVAAGGGDTGASPDASAPQTQVTRTFLADISSFLTSQREHAAAAHARSGEIGATARSIEALSRAAQILSLNAKIETARSTDAGGAFAAISDEMQKLATAVQKANSQIAELGAKLVTSLPQVSELAVRMERLTQAFSVELAQTIDRAQEAERRLRENIVSALQAGEQVLQEVVAQAGEGLSHLQFQDSMAQGLLEIDRWLHDLETRLAAALHVDAKPMPPLHVTVSRDGNYDSKQAGELLLL